ncbi:hypothetical protein ABBQ38_006382 [Trebouxia sp. C0009 RCD-2024]
MSAQLQDITSARRCKLLCNLSSQLQSVCSVMICQLGSSLLAQSVKSAAIRQLSCDVSAQLRGGQVRLALIRRLSCSFISAAMSAATSQLSCNLSNHGLSVWTHSKAAAVTWHSSWTTACKHQYDCTWHRPNSAASQTDCQNNRAEHHCVTEYRRTDKVQSTGKVDSFGWLRYSGFARHKDPKLDAAGALADLLVFSLNLTGLNILDKIESQDSSWVMFKDIWHADKQQDRNALMKPLQNILQEVRGSPVVKTKRCTCSAFDCESRMAMANS